MKRFLFALALFGCGPKLPRELIANHPRLKVEIVKPQVVEASAPIPPVWTRRIDRGAVGHVPFAGQSAAGSMDAAQKQAMDDLLNAVSNFVSVEVESEFEAIESEKKRGATSESSLEVHSSVKTRSRSKIEGVQADEVYWEKVLDSPLSANAVSYRVYVHATVPKSKIARARLERQLERQKKSGKKMVVVLPFRPAGALSNAFLEEVSRRLNAPDLAVTDPGLVAALLAAEDRGEAETLETVRDALLPDFVIGGSYQLHEGRVRATYTLYSGPDGRVLETKSFDKRYEDLFSLQDAIVESLSAKLSTAQSTSPPGSPRPQLEAWALHHLAGDDYAAGRNDQAIEKLKKVLALEPSFGEAHLRLGRIYERLGRYGRVPPASRDQQPRRLELYPCVPWSRISDRSFDEFVSVREGSRDAVEGLLDAKEWVDVDHVRSAVEFVLGGGHVPEPPVPAVALSAAGAYWNAFKAAEQSGDERLLLEVEIALADLFVRVDRHAGAEQLYRDAIARAEKQQSLHHQSLGWFGLGRLARIQNRYELAGEVLLNALRLRSLLGEKPYLLEIYNELGHWSVELSQFSAARAFYSRALRLAEELDHDYPLAVLANNVGVLLLEEGHFPEAERYLLKAFDHLRELGEAEGRIASGLNLHLVGAARGDRERARAYLEETRRLILKTNQETHLAELHAHRGFLLGLEGERLDAIRDLLRSWALYSNLDRPVQSLRLANDLSVAEFYESAESGRVPTSCLRDRWHRLLEEGWGWDESRLADDYYWWYRRGDSYRRAPLPVTIGKVLGGARGASYWYTLLNAEVMARLSGGGW